MARYLRKVTDNSITVVADDDDETLHTLLSQVTSGADVPANTSPKPLYEETSEAWVLQHGGASSHPAQSGSGGVTPTTLVLGPYTMPGASAGADPVFVDEIVDLGANAIGVVNYEIVLTAIDFDGGTPSSCPIDFDSSIDGEHWATDGSTSGVAQRPLLLNAPAGVPTDTLPATAAGTTLLSRFTRMVVAWNNGDQGPASSMTFHVNLSYF